MSEANKRQVGGEHYKTGGTEHWDLFGLDYLVGCATKYVSRWRKKQGTQDLEKALHYAQKILERVRRGEKYLSSAPRSMVQAWAPNADVRWAELVIIERLMFFDTERDVQIAVDGIEFLLAGAQGIKTASETMREERRVPRFDRAPETHPTHRWPSGDAPVVSRTPEDGGHHSGLYPWQTHKKPRELLDKFYRQVARDIFRLEAVVEGLALPKELHGFYDIDESQARFILRMERVPEDLRDCYPRLPRELNMKECEEHPFGFMYEMTDAADGKYVLKPRYAAHWS